MAEKQEKKDSSVVAQKGKSAYNSYKNVKKAYKAVKAARAGWAAAQTTVALASNPVGWAVAIGIGILILIVFIIVLFGSVSSTNNNTSTSSTTPIIENVAYEPFSGDISEYFVFYGGTDSERKELENYLRIALGYPKLPSMLKTAEKGKISITIDKTTANCSLGGWAEANSNGNITVCGNYMNSESNTKKLYLIHELGHSIAYRNGNADAFYAISTKDSACYDTSGYIKTYPTSFHVAAVYQHKQESFAESLINTMFCKSGQTCGPNGITSPPDGPIQDWPSTCVNTYNWMMQNVLQGEANSQNLTGSKSDSLISWATKISNAIEISSCNVYKKKKQVIVNTSGDKAAIRDGSCGLDGLAYLCSRFVIDTYKLAEVTKYNFSEWVPTMINQWDNVKGLVLLKENNVKKVMPGDAVFWYGKASGCGSCWRHTAIVKSIDVNSNGNGVLYTLDANVNEKEIKHYVKDWKLSGGVWTDAATDVRFGLGPRQATGPR